MIPHCMRAMKNNQTVCSILNTGFPIMKINDARILNGEDQKIYF